MISELVRPKPHVDVLDWFGPRILPIVPDVAIHWGRLLAAAALHHDLRLVTRNTKDFDYMALEVINPWGEATR